MEVDEFCRNDRNTDHEIQRQKAIEKKLDCKFFRIYPDEQNFNERKVINEIYRQIKKSTKKSLIGKISKRLLELQFKSNHSIKCLQLNKVFTAYCSKNIAIIIKHANLLFELLNTH